MTMPVAPRRIHHSGDGTSVTFTYPFRIFSSNDLLVYVAGTLQTTGYVVNGVGSGTGGNVVFTTPPASGAAVALVRKTAVKREADFQAAGEFTARALNQEQDYQTAVMQDLDDRVSRAITLSTDDNASGISLEIPSVSARANKVVAFDATGSVIVQEAGSGGGGGVTDHGSLTGLSDDDHTLYHTASRANTWLATKTTDNLTQGSNNKYMTLAGSGSATNASRSDHDHAGVYSQTTHDHTGTYEPVISPKNSAFNTSFGTSAGQSAEGNHSHNLSNLADVTVTAPAVNQAIVWDGGKWINQAQTGGGSLLFGPRWGPISGRQLLLVRWS